LRFFGGRNERVSGGSTFLERTRGESPFALAQVPKVGNISNRGGIVVSGERSAGGYRMEESSEVFA
jgi:hypothetical protein